MGYGQPNISIIGVPGPPGIVFRPVLWCGSHPKRCEASTQITGRGPIFRERVPWRPMRVRDYSSLTILPKAIQASGWSVGLFV